MLLLVEAEQPGDSWSLFRVTLNGRTLGAGLTAAQGHLIVGDALEDFVAPGRREGRESSPSVPDREPSRR
jgi:hypothetical protein